MDFSNSLLNVKTNIDVSKSLFLTLGEMSLKLIMDVFKPVVNNLLNLINIFLNDKKIFDKEIFKCLSDLLNNKDNSYTELVLKKLDINFLLSKLFKTKISKYKIDFLISLMNSFESSSDIYFMITIIRLNVISLIFYDEDFNCKYFFDKEGNKLSKLN